MWYDNNIQSYINFQAAFLVFKLSVHDEIKLRKLYAHQIVYIWYIEFDTRFLGLYVYKMNALTYGTLAAFFPYITFLRWQYLSNVEIAFNYLSCISGFIRKKRLISKFMASQPG